MLNQLDDELMSSFQPLEQEVRRLKERVHQLEEENRRLRATKTIIVGDLPKFGE